MSSLFRRPTVRYFVLKITLNEALEMVYRMLKNSPRWIEGTRMAARQGNQRRIRERILYLYTQLFTYLPRADPDYHLRVEGRGGSQKFHYMQ